MGLIDSSWPVLVAVAITMFCSFFVQSGEGAVFAMVPLVKRRLTGQVAGMTGAYGNVGAVSFLTVFSFVSPQMFFLVIAGAAVVTLAIVALFLDEPEGHMAEVLAGWHGADDRGDLTHRRIPVGAPCRRDKLIFAPARRSYRYYQPTCLPP